VLRDLLRNDDRIVLDIKSFAPCYRKPSTIDELDHLLSHDRHLKDLSDRRTFLGILIEQSANESLELWAIAGRDRFVFVLDYFVD